MWKCKHYFKEEIQKCKPSPELENAKTDAIVQLGNQAIFHLGDVEMQGCLSSKIRK